jgi:putative photosynthetic complex assembly protein 2
VTEAWISGLYALFVWWFGTGAVLLADRVPGSAHRTVMALASILAIGALVAIALTAGQRSLASALTAFTATVVVWGWHELSFLTGRLTGPRKTACPPGATGWRRFACAAGTLIHHEIAMAPRRTSPSGAPTTISAWARTPT